MNQGVNALRPVFHRVDLVVVAKLVLDETLHLRLERWSLTDADDVGVHLLDDGGDTVRDALRVLRLGPEAGCVLVLLRQQFRFARLE